MRLINLINKQLLRDVKNDAVSAPQISPFQWKTARNTRS